MLNDTRIKCTVITVYSHINWKSFIWMFCFCSFLSRSYDRIKEVLFLDNLVLFFNSLQYERPVVSVPN